nr:hypothetical protein BaRGS_002546 [Batillaria attramentaria]
MDVQVRRRKWRWVGHTLRKEPGCNITRQALEWNPQGKEEEKAPQADLEEELALRVDMGGGQDLRQGQSEMEKTC